MFYVYILKSQTTKRYYIGSTQDVENRVREHNRGETISRRKEIPGEIIHVEEFKTGAGVLNR